MTIPENNVFVDGQGQVDADALNTFIQTCNTMADLRAFIGAAGMQVNVLGQNAVNDKGGGTFYWNAAGTAADDNGVTTVVPSGSGSGEWTRLTAITQPAGARASNSGIGDPTGTTLMTGVMMGTGITFTPNRSGQFILGWSGRLANGTAPNGCLVAMRYGTGTPPVNGAAPAGTFVCQTEGDSGANGEHLPFALSGFVSGLVIGTAYWLDLEVAAQGGGTASVSYLCGTYIEF